MDREVSVLLETTSDNALALGVRGNEEWASKVPSRGMKNWSDQLVGHHSMAEDPCQSCSSSSRSLSGPPYNPWQMKSAMRSPMTMVVTLVLALMQSGMIEASATRSPSSPWTLPNWSTTATESEAGPILHVLEL